jgi:hypothetical protein
MAESLRLLFEWNERKISLRKVTPVNKRAPASEQPEGRGMQEAPARLGVELRLRVGERDLYARHVGQLFPDSYEVQTGDPDRPFARAPRGKPYTVEIIVPDAHAKARVVLTERRMDAKAKKCPPPRLVTLVDEPLASLRSDDSSERRP